MRDVAALAGVSLKTVSRVVNDEPGVSPDLCARVTDAVGRLDYRQNHLARSLRRTGRHSSSIGLLLVDVSNPFSSALHRAVEEVAREHNTFVLTGSSDDDPERERALVAALVERRVDGLIAVPAAPSRVLAREQELGTPLVLVDRTGPARTDAVTVDNHAGARTAVAHLAAAGHRRIAYLGDRAELYTAAERYRGYVEGLAVAGLRLDPALVRHGVAQSGVAAAAVHDLLQGQSPPTALFTAQNLITMGAVRALQERQCRHRVALVGFDDIPAADLLDPPVTVIHQDVSALGRAAADLLLGRIAGDTGAAQHVVVPTRLVVRGSGEIAPPAG